MLIVYWENCVSTSIFETDFTTKIIIIIVFRWFEEMNQTTIFEILKNYLIVYINYITNCSILLE